MKIKEFATKNLELITPETSIGEAAKKMSERDIGILFVQKNDKLIGVLTDRDIVIRANAKGIGSETPVKNIMTQKVLYCFEDESVEAVANNFAQNQIRRLPVLNHDKRLVGVVSIGDLGRKNQKEAISTAFFGISQPTKTNYKF